jgi:alpha-1,3-rhamnosyl/mannosyltransferase
MPAVGGDGALPASLRGAEMRVILNALASLKPRTGIGHYIHSLCEHLLPIVGPEQLVLFPGAVARRFIGSLFSRRIHTASPTQRGSGLPLRRLLAAPLKLLKHVGVRAARQSFRAFVNRSGCDLYHEPNYIPWPCDVPAIATVHDLSVLLHPDWHPAERVKFYETHFFRNLQRCRHLIADSDAIRGELIDRLGMRTERVTTVHLAVRPGFRPQPAAEVAAVLRRFDLQPGYLLHVGTIEPRKNLLMLMRAYCDLPAALRQAHPLVLIGGWGWRNREVREFYENKGRREGVRQIGYAAEEDLPAIYSGARALVFPSHYEGFGFPPLEMMACGGAVIASTADSLREILPERTRLQSPHDLAAWREAMSEMLRDDDLWKQSREGVVAHAGQFTWEKCARQTWEVYRRVMSSRQSTSVAA